MVKHRRDKPRRVFAFEPLRVVHLEEILSWIWAGGPGKDEAPDEQALFNRMYAEFRRQYRPLWHSGTVDSFVMTVNRVPVFCVSLLRMDPPAARMQGARGEAHLYLIFRPQVRASERLLVLAWQAATVYAFLRMGFSRVQTAIDADAVEENEALLMLGYRQVETISEISGKMNLYSCGEFDLRMVM